jgi:Tfp pilus assembly protein FimT
MTLIELLVVIIILTTIVAAAIPIMAPADEDRRLREASRLLNTFITSAQARAIATNRLYGIGLKRLSSDTQRPEDRGVCVQAYYIEQQPPYAGFDSNSRARMAFYTPQNSSWYGGNQALVRIQFATRGIGNAGQPIGWTADLFPSGMVRPGDLIEIYGSQFQLLADTSDTAIPPKFDENGFFTSETGKKAANQPAQIAAKPLRGIGQMLNMTHDNEGEEIGTPAGIDPPFFTFPASYKIFRQPVTAADEPFQMPEGTAIDLRASGFGNDATGYFYWPEQDDDPNDDSDAVDNTEPVLILFTPEGKVARLRYNQFPKGGVFDEPIVEDLYLLVGQRGKIPAPQLDRDKTLSTADYPPETKKDAREQAREPLNWLSGTSRWIVIGSQSGRIATVANTFVDPAAIMQVMSDQRTENLRGQQILAARELTKLTTQETAR